MKLHPPRTLAGYRPHLALRHRRRRRRLRARGLFCRCQHRHLLARQAVPRRAHLALDARSLPAYAFYSVVRIAIAYLLSLIFAVAYGYMAAYNPRVEAWMIAVLDILQSIPVLSFLPPVVLAMVALIPASSDGHRDGRHPAHLHRARSGIWPSAFTPR